MINKPVAQPTNPPRLVRAADARLPTSFGTFRAVGYFDGVTSSEYVALVAGDVREVRDVPVAVIRECIAGHVFGSLACDCWQTTVSALEEIAAAACGVVIYLRNREWHPTGCPVSGDGSAVEPLVSEILADLGAGSVRFLVAPRQHALGSVAAC